MWNQFASAGHVPENLPDWRAATGFAEAETGLPTAAIAVKTKLAPGESRNVTFALAWDFPVITFGAGRSWKRAYTTEWGAKGDQAARIACHAITNHRQWRDEINAWHARHADENGNDPHRAGMMLNELYFLVDGNTVWTARQTKAPSHFGLIECPDYDFYNALDLWAYASEAIFRHWPELEHLVMDLARTGWRQQSRIEASFQTFHKYYREYIWEKEAKLAAVSDAEEGVDLSDFVSFELPPAQPLSEVVRRNLLQIVCLILFIVVGYAGAYVAMLRYDVR